MKNSPNQFLELKKPRKNISKALRMAVWETYLGVGVKHAFCPICGIKAIYKTDTAGFETAHIIAQGYCTESEDDSVLYLYPCCSGCNNECRTLCIIDYMYGRGRIKELRRMIMSIYHKFCVIHEHELSRHDYMAWKVLRFLYGPDHFKAGGGLQNTKQIYEMARMCQYEELVREAKELSEKLEKNATIMRELMECEIKPMRLQ